MDGDLQDPPEVLPHPQRAEGGHDAGKRADTNHQHRVPDQQRGVAERQHADPGSPELR